MLWCMRFLTAQKITLGILLAAAFVPIILFVPTIQQVFAATCTWSGGSGAWETAGNWTNCGGGVPGALDDAVINANVTVTINASTTINSLTLGNVSGTTSPVLNFAYDAIANGALIIDDGNLTVYTSANITHSTASGGTIVGKVYIDVQTGSATIDGTINVGAKGYAGGGIDHAGYGPGGGAQWGVGQSCSGPGGGYGGVGGFSDCYTTGGTAYGSVNSPDDLGSGGNGGDDAASGGGGGGAVKLFVGDTLSLGGSISANGGNGGNDAGEDGGGGSGGSIWLDAGTISGSGTLSVNGGTGSNEGGGGAGGRVAIYYTTDSFSGSITTEPGTGAHYGGNGTIYKKDSTETYGDLLIDSAISANTGAVLCEDDTCDGSLSVTFNDVTLNHYSKLTHLDNTNTQTNWLVLTADNLTVTTDASIEVDYKGYSGGGVDQAGNGPGGAGPGVVSGDCAGPGASHGGEGGNSNCYSGALPYGSVDTPNQLGSGGSGGDDEARGGDGGGYVHITLNETLTLNGTITANGENGATDSGGGNENGGAGSGGSVWLDVTTFTGSGVLTCIGGTGTDRGGGGSGGRIAVYYTTNTFSGTVSVESGNGNQYGGLGTIYLKDSAETYGDLLITSILSSNKGANLCDDDDCSGSYTPTFNDVTIDNYGNLTHLGNNDTQLNWLEFTADTLSVSTNAKIDLTGKGFRGGDTNEDGKGPGGGTRGAANGDAAAGAGYGGDGANSQQRGGGAPYGTVDDPQVHGSGGGGVYDANASGGDGGGFAKLTINNTLTVNGTLTANGGNGANDPDGGPEDAGGGSGGSIWLDIGTLIGSGVISSNGGNGPTPAGGGSGGRIGIYYTTNSFSGTIEVEPGTGYQYAGLGTIFLKHDAETYGDLLIDASSPNTKGAILCDNDVCDGTVDVTFDDVVIDNYGILSHRENSTAKTYWVVFTCDTLTINANAQINTYARGYTGGAIAHKGNGPGAGGPSTIAESCSGLGGGHGGLAGSSNCYESYYASGTVTTPNELGSGGGGGQDSVVGGDGGGFVHIIANDTVTVSGSINVNGANGGNDGDESSGGGAGGSIWIDTDTFTGSGTLTANGGSGPGSAGSGSGGRVAIYYYTDNFTGTISIEPGTSTRVGGSGTLYKRVKSHPQGDLIVTTPTANKGTVLCTDNICNGTVVHTFEDVVIEDYGILTHPTNFTTQTYWLRINAENMTITDNGKLDVSGQGYNGGGVDQGGQGPGAGGPTNIGNGCAGCGGGYGGNGGRSNCYNLGGAPYGSETDVLYTGSGGAGGEDTAIGGDGGGLVDLYVLKTLTVDSGIYANGINATTDGTEDGGGGAGGGIDIATSVLTGSGVIEATGGASGTSGGGGAGGRIYIQYTLNDWTGNTLVDSVATAGGTGYDAGDNGTIYLDNSPVEGSLVTKLTVSNIAPTFTAAPYELTASTSTNPTNVGTNVTFRATATDENHDNYFLAICKTNAITAGSGSAPSCDGGSWCISSSTLYETEASCNYQAQLADVESNSWYGFVCDENDCSSSSQGSGDNGSPFEVNHAPTISATSAGSGNPQGYGSGYTITVTTTASDSDTSGTSDTTKVVVCADNSGATSAGCEGGDDLCSSSLVASDPSCNFDLPTVIEDGNYNYYAYVFDSHNFGTNSSTSTYTVNNVDSTVSAVTLNGGSDITLNDQTTSGGITNVILTATVVDYNSCQDLNSVKGYLYRTGTGYAGCDTLGEADNNHCYAEVSCSTVDCSGTSDDTANFSCTVSMRYHADPTDGASSSDSPWYDQTWKDAVKAIDDSAAEDVVEVATGVEVNSTTAFTITTVLSGPKIGYGSMALGADSGLVDDTDTNQITTLAATGNVGLDQEISGTTLARLSYIIPIANQKHSFSSFTYSSGGTVLGAAVTEYEQNCPKTTITASPVTAKTYWGILIPSNSGSGIYTGTNYLNGVKSEAGEW